MWLSGRQIEGMALLWRIASQSVVCYEPCDGTFRRRVGRTRRCGWRGKLFDWFQSLSKPQNKFFWNFPFGIKSIAF